MWTLFRERGFIKEADADFEHACEALRDFLPLAYTFEQLMPAVPPDELRPRAQALLKDEVLPNTGSQDTPGRDVQSELYFAAVCQAAGLRPVLAEPDIVVRQGGQRYGLAVKRLKNTAKLQRRFSAGARQIEESGMPGFVILHLSLALNPDNRRICTPLGDRAFFQMEDARLSRVMRQHADSFVKWRQGREVRGVILHDDIISKLADGNWSIRGFDLFSHIDKSNQRRQREAHAFFRQYRRGIYNAIDC